MTKISGSRSISQRHGSADPDPHQNVMDPEHWYILFGVAYTANLFSFSWSDPGGDAVPEPHVCEPNPGLSRWPGRLQRPLPCLRRSSFTSFPALVQAGHFYYVWYQCCGSGLFIPDPNFFPSRIPDPGSKRFRIPDPDPHKRI
jgi:hypothetical protein